MTASRTGLLRARNGRRTTTIYLRRRRAAAVRTTVVRKRPLPRKARVLVEVMAFDAFSLTTAQAWSPALPLTRTD